MVPELEILASAFPHATLTPFKQDTFLFAGFDFAFDNSAKWSDEDIHAHANDESFRVAVNDLLAKFTTPQ